MGYLVLNRMVAYLDSSRNSGKNIWSQTANELLVISDMMHLSRTISRLL